MSIIQASLKSNSALEKAIYFHFLLLNSTLPLQKQRYLKQLGHHYQRLLINIILITISIARVLGHRRRKLRVPVRLLGRKDPRSRMDVICAVLNAWSQFRTRRHVPVVLGKSPSSRLQGVLKKYSNVFIILNLCYV